MNEEQELNEVASGGSGLNVELGCDAFVAMDYAPGPDRCVVTCTQCGASYDVQNGPLPEIGWCCCDPHSNAKLTSPPPVSFDNKLDYGGGSG